MYQQERMDQIMKILKENHYVTVEYLVEKIRYSPASIRRDLTLLEKQGLVKRSYGGVTLGDANISPYRFRQHSMKVAKNAIAKRAAELVKDGDTVFIDGSSTTQYIGHFLTEKKNITVVTCNMLLADFLSEHGIMVYCTGGRVVEYPGILGGELARETFKKFKADIAFFASLSFDFDGKILSSGEGGRQSARALREHSKKLVYLCGSDKFNSTGHIVSITLDEIDYFISDGKLPAKLKEKFKNTTFISTK